MRQWYTYLYCSTQRRATLSQLAETQARAVAAGINYTPGFVESLDSESKPTPTPYLILEMPNGRTKRRLRITESRAKELNLQDFEHFIFLGELAAFLDTGTGEIEALVTTHGFYSSRTVLTRLAEARRDPIRSSEDEQLELAAEIGDAETNDNSIIRLDGETPDFWAGLGPASRLLNSLEAGFVPFGRHSPISLRIYSKGTSRHDDALKLLREFANSLFFELDLIHQMSLGLRESREVSRIRRERVRRDATLGPATARIPTNAYTQKPTSLYMYGRSVQGMPLLEFLAYYQCIEFHFPIYAELERRQKLRTELIDPRFSASNDECLTRVLGILNSSTRGASPESTQLRATISQCVDASVMKFFIQNNPGMEEHLTSRKQEISSLKPLTFDNQDYSLTDQLADRIYQIRCRIVHTKEDGGPRSQPMLLPFGDEVSHLGTDIALIRFIAQKVLVAGAHPGSWT